MKKKVFHIVSNKEWGGGEQYVYDLSRRQQADGIDVSIFCKPINGIISKYQEAGIQVYPLKLGGILDFKSACMMAAIIKKAESCIIHAHNFKDAFTACFARKLSGMKQIRVVMCRHLTRKGKNTIPYKWLYRQIDCLCFDSEISKLIFLSTNPTIDHRLLCIVHTSIVVPNQIETASLRSEFNIPANCVLALYHGRLDFEKGLDVLVKAVELIKDKQFRLILIGNGSDEYTAHLHQIIEKDGLQHHIFLAGFRHPVMPYVAAADFGVLASTVSEGCPLSPQEYMSQGHPVVATNNGGQREYINDDKNGLLVPPNDAKALAHAMGQLIDDPDLRLRLGKQAKEDFEDHMTYEHFYALISKIYED